MASSTCIKKRAYASFLLVLHIEEAIREGERGKCEHTRYPDPRNRRYQPSTSGKRSKHRLLVVAPRATQEKKCHRHDYLKRCLHSAWEHTGRYPPLRKMGSRPRFSHDNRLPSALIPTPSAVTLARRNTTTSLADTFVPHLYNSWSSSEIRTGGPNSTTALALKRCPRK